ncbi:MAG: M28 family peptidase, partial [Myxococcales bacterium]|nr:M28 family peptidase [Myxococcales bacterium]
IAEQFSRLGLRGELAAGDYCQLFARTGMAADQNVVARLGTGFSAQPTVVIGAHYDTHELTVEGALDNATGVAAMLEVARLAAREEWPFDIVFVAFGSQFNYPSGAQQFGVGLMSSYNSLAFVELDAVGVPISGSYGLAAEFGEQPETIGFVVGYGSPAESREIVASASESSGVATVEVPTYLASSLGMGGDFSTLESYATTISFGTGNSPYIHSTQDTVERVDFDQVERAVGLTMGVLEALRSDEGTSR